MSTLVLINDSCVNQKVDVIVNAANRHLAAGGGVCGAIFSKADLTELSSGIFGGDLEDPVSESTKQCCRAYQKFIDNYPDYEINVTLCAYTDYEYVLALRHPYFAANK